MLAVFGVMQGRLSPPEEGRFQSFPRNSWRQEFIGARDAGISYIEWIYDDYGASANPIATVEAQGGDQSGLKEQQWELSDARHLRRLVDGLPSGFVARNRSTNSGSGSAP